MVHINMKFKALQRREGGEIKTQDYMDCMQACYAEQACIIKILKNPFFSAVGVFRHIPFTNNTGK